MSRPIRLYISRQNLAHNLSIVRKNAPLSKIMAVVKANAYGHGAVEVSKEFVNAGADALAVCSIDEAIDIKDAKVSTPIVLLEGFFSEQELSKIISLKLIPVVHSKEQLAVLKDYKINGELNLIVKIDTGMHRLGFKPEEFAKIYSELLKLANVNIFALMSHFARADEPQHVNNSRQLAEFKKMVNKIQADKSMANSAAILALSEAHYDWVRPGIMLYGSNPFLSGNYQDFNLKPVMRFESEVIEIKNVKAGGEAGYGGTWTAGKDSRLAVVAAGYGDGYPRHAPNGTPVAINDKIAPLAGRVSMDMLTVDISQISGVKVGDKVELWGDLVAADEVAQKSGTISYELFCSVTSRVPRIYD